MEKLKGKLYSNKEGNMVLMCTGLGVKPKWGNYETMSAVVVHQFDEFSEIKVGATSDTWNAKYFEEYKGEIVLNNENWKDPAIAGNCPS